MSTTHWETVETEPSLSLRLGSFRRDTSGDEYCVRRRSTITGKWSLSAYILKGLLRVSAVAAIFDKNTILHCYVLYSFDCRFPVVRGAIFGRGAWASVKDASGSRSWPEVSIGMTRNHQHRKLRSDWKYLKRKIYKLHMSSRYFMSYTRYKICSSNIRRVSLS